ncbi:MAG: hypothetical protein HZT43_04420 [Exiguobacterium profundum]|nr:MAG: hypothetical protein HZT43_04420 [Exiguobacterium profundum]
MKKPVLLATLAAASLSVLSTAAVATRSRAPACGRPGATRAMCGCIQQAADQTLSNADQRRAASFFKDPDKAHKVWLSKSDKDDEFWERYKNFGATAEAYCAG